MGVMKRLVGWRDSRWPIPNTLQMLAGMIPYRDPEAFLERKRFAREAAAERAAIQADRPAAPAPIMTKNMYQPIQELAATDPDLGDELPFRAADGWYRYGRTFYRVGFGPVAGWGFPSPSLPPATRQGMLLLGG
jgi:hypothetical protein